MLKSGERCAEDPNLEPPIVTFLVKLLAEKEGKSIKKIPLTIEEALHTITLQKKEAADQI